jgi:hypothetical protein
VPRRGHPPSQAWQEPGPLTAQLWRRRRWVALGVLVAIVAVLVVNYRIELTPPSLQRDSAEFAAATSNVLVDFPGKSALLDVDRSVGPLVERSNVYARLGASPAVRARIAEQVGMDPTEIDIRGPYNPTALRINREPTAERRATQLRDEARRYRIRFDSERGEAVPIVLIYAQAPTVAGARELADAAANGLIGYVKQIQRRQGLADSVRLRLRQLGPSDGAMVNPGADRQIAALVFVAALLAWSSLVLIASNMRRFLASRAPQARGPTDPDARLGTSWPSGSPALFDVEVERDARLRSAGSFR